MYQPLAKGVRDQFTVDPAVRDQGHQVVGRLRTAFPGLGVEVVVEILDRSHPHLPSHIGVELHWLTLLLRIVRAEELLGPWVSLSMIRSSSWAHRRGS